MTASQNPARVARKVLWYQIAVVALSLGILVVSYQYWVLNRQANLKIPLQKDALSDTKGIPFYHEVMDIIQPLEYSGTQSLTSGRVHLTIDFARNTWTLHNLHQFDSNGQLILENYRFGLCGELADYTYNRIKPILANKYEIFFGQVAESGFFLAPRATHIVLLIREKNTDKTYLVDPTFHRYGRLTDFQEYLFFGHSTTLAGLEQKNPDVSFPTDHATPLLIRNDFISSFLVGSVDGKFDQDNFVLSIRANRRFKYTGRTIYAVRKKDGETDTFEDKWLMHEALSVEEIAKLKSTLLEWFNALDPMVNK